MSWLQAAAGVAGLLGAFGQNKKASGYENAAAQDIALRSRIRNQMRSIADGYDPARETQSAVDYGAKTSALAIQQALAGLNSRFRAMGGNPAGDTAFKFNSDADIRRISNPLQAFAAQERAMETQRRMDMYGRALGGNDVTGDYLALANSSRVDPAGAMGIFAGGLEDLGIFGGQAAPASGAVMGASRNVLDRFRQQSNRVNAMDAARGLSDRFRAGGLA